jgi:RNA polymerase sigma-70 factor (ECF subfamily)
MVVIAGDARILGFGRRDASAEVDRLYRRHADEVLRYVMLVLRSRTDAEDVVQATFIRAFRALARGERVQKPRNWLIKIAHNECRRALATRSRRAVEVELEEVPVEQVESGRAESLRAALSQLTTKQREVLVLRELEGRSYSEIATTLEVSESAVETLLFRARRAVREQLEDVLDCDAARALIEQETLSDPQRRLLRAHTRACSDCSTVERQARGRKGALRRIASSFGLPSFCKTLLGKILVVAATASAVGITGVAIAEPPAKRLPDVAPLQVDRPQISPVVGPRHATARARTRVVRARPALGRPTRPSVGSPARVQRRVLRAPEVTSVAPPPPPAVAAATPEPAAPATSVPAPAAKPVLPLPKLPVELAVPALPVPQLPVSVPVPVPTVELPPLPVDLPVAAPQVPGLPSVP